jgi:hypothetical protein
VLGAGPFHPPAICRDKGWEPWACWKH